MSARIATLGGLGRLGGQRLLSRLEGGAIELHERGGRWSFGTPGADLRVRVDVHDDRAWTRLMRGSTGFGEGYVEGYWDTDDLVGLTRILARNMPAIDRLRRRWHPVLGRLQRLAPLVPRNSRRGARSNISAHYDLGNELFSSFLDRRLMYSCAYFPHEGASLEDAQLAKLDRVCERLELASGDHLLEIGTGWGGMAIHAATEYGCRVTTTTISREQHAYATRRVRELGLAGRVTVLDRDYRDLTGRFDKLVSIEMIEAVGWQYFDTFFRKCSELIQPDGLMLLQAIVIADDAYEVEKASKSFANTHVFPGGCLPSERLIGGMIGSQTDMRPLWADDITPHYAETLRIWRERFNQAAPGLSRGYDERFRRLWNFYLAFCEGGFRERRIRDLQLLFAKPEHHARTAAAQGRGEPAMA